jgi:dihydrofolate reductase
MDTGRGPNWAVGGRPVPGLAVSASLAAGNTIDRRTEMGRIIISENVSLDGVVQDPTGEEGFSRGGWFLGVRDKDNEAWAKVETDEALRAGALLLGRGSYEYFASRWASRTGVWADRLNSMPKYVVTSTLEHPGWNNSTVIKGNVVNEVSKLKQKLDGEIVVYASRQLVHTLIEHDLVDEYRLLYFPVHLGTGKKLFRDGAPAATLRLVSATTTSTGVIIATYQPAGQVELGSYALDQG